MSQYFPKSYEPFGEDINVKVLLSNYAIKTDINSAENKYHSSVSHHEKKSQKTTSQIKFSAVTVRKTDKTSLTTLSM